MKRHKDFFISQFAKKKNYMTFVGEIICNLAPSYITCGTTSNMKIDTIFGEGNLTVSNRSTSAFTFQPRQLFLGIHPEGVHIAIQKCICIRLFTAALFVITKY